MPAPCVVPNCNNLYGENRSVFRMPRNAVQYKQWVAAIPGILTLKPTHFVCDKHFNKEDIIREWIKRDSNGRIIAQEPYKRPYLRKLAVPSKFHDLSTTKDTIRTR
ncbi:PREDICTED: uncharacterized protein LOC105557389 [Vollenhovia emeryi]|uniref:uncharacterized protein LOC105557389 n=1 Tax=Vollenhovia emeryi TaxID=411798 RepID=UPI0005F53264|nr:PREDICTED: uncharacterized protein LOC105557389 [Vollenhovia emeryi]